MNSPATQRPFDVFISYSSQNKLEADAVCAKLEAGGIRCWIAPRDVLPGSEWGESIIEALEKSRIMVLIFSEYANGSPQVRREVERAVAKEVPIIPFRVQNILPARALEFGLSNTHWLDAFDPPLEKHVVRLEGTLRQFLALGGGKVRSSLPRNNEPETVAQPVPRRNATPWIATAAVLVLLAGAAFFGMNRRGRIGGSGGDLDFPGKDFVGHWTFLHGGNSVQTNLGDGWMSVTTFDEDWVTIDRSPTNGLILAGTKAASKTETLTGSAAGSITTFDVAYPPGASVSYRHFVSNGKTTSETSNHTSFFFETEYLPERNMFVARRHLVRSDQSMSPVFTNAVCYTLDKTKTKLVKIIVGGGFRSRDGIPAPSSWRFSISNELQVTPEFVEQMVQWNDQPHTNRPAFIIDASTYAVKAAP